MPLDAAVLGALRRVGTLLVDEVIVPAVGFAVLVGTTAGVLRWLS